jgi:hypothetical protein
VEPANTLVGIEPGLRNHYYVAQIAVQDLLRLGLTVVPDPNPEGPLGRAIIPELSWQAYQGDSLKFSLRAADPVLRETRKKNWPSKWPMGNR